MLTKVVLPEPDLPIIPILSPFDILIFILSNTGIEFFHTEIQDRLLIYPY